LLLLSQTGPVVVCFLARNGEIVLRVSKIDKERYGYDIELSNDLELKFNHQGAIIGYDD
jgi:hypothetical protein